MCLDEVGILLTSKKHISICGSESAECRTEFWDFTLIIFKLFIITKAMGALCKFNMFDFTIFSILCLDEVGILLTSKKHLSICGSESAECRTEFWGLYVDNFEIVYI
jgi:hypothetical protein